MTHNVDNPSTPSTEKTPSSPQRTFYVEESFAVNSGVILRADPLLTELVSTVR